MRTKIGRLVAVVLSFFVYSKMAAATDYQSELPFRKKFEQFLVTEGVLASMSAMTAYAPQPFGVLQGLIVVPYGILMTTSYEQSRSNFLSWLTVGMVSAIAIYNVTEENKPGFDSKIFAINYAAWNATMAVATINDWNLEKRRNYLNYTINIQPISHSRFSATFTVLF